MLSIGMPAACLLIPDSYSRLFCMQALFLMYYVSAYLQGHLLHYEYRTQARCLLTWRSLNSAASCSFWRGSWSLYKMASGCLV